MIMHTVVETPVFIRGATQAGMTETELNEIRTFLADNPGAGDLMPGTGGARKIRLASKIGLWTRKVVIHINQQVTRKRCFL